VSNVKSAGITLSSTIREWNNWYFEDWDGGFVPGHKSGRKSGLIRFPQTNNLRSASLAK
jgi:hypothetical protein